MTEELELLRRNVRSFLEREVVPRLEGWERNGIPREALRELVGLGYLFPEAEGVTERSEEAAWWAVVAEELGRAGAGSLAAMVESHISAVWLLAAAGETVERARYLAGERLLTWPWDAGPVRLEEQDSRRYVEGLAGTVVASADEALVAVTTEAGKRLVLVPLEDPALRLLPVPGVGLAAASLRRLECAGAGFREPELPGCGDVGGHLREGLARRRLWLAWLLVGLGDWCLRQAFAYVAARQQFGRAVMQFQALQHRLADVAVGLLAARQMANLAVKKWGTTEDLLAGTLALVVAGQAAFLAADEAVQFHGGYGYMLEYPVQRTWRDVRQLTLLVGGPVGLAREAGQQLYSSPRFCLAPLGEE